MINNLSDELPTFVVGRTNGLRIDGHLPQVLELVQLQDKLQMSESLNQRNHHQVVLSGQSLNRLNVVSSKSVFGGDVPKKSPEREHVLILEEQGRRSGVLQEGEDRLQVGQLWRGSLEVEVDDSMFWNVPAAFLRLFLVNNFDFVDVDDFRLKGIARGCDCAEHLRFEESDFSAR